MARPREHDRTKIVEAVCLEIGGGKLVKAACRTQGITGGQLREWIAADKALSVLYARAREEQAHAIAEDAVRLADGARAGKFGNVDKVRVQVDARKWLASKIAPRHYGDRLELAGDKGAPITVKVMFSRE